jgi:hypothetical protein
MPSDLQVSNIKDLTGSNTGLSIASDGQVTISQNNPTITLGANTTFPSGNSYFVSDFNTNLDDSGDQTVNLTYGFGTVVGPISVPNNVKIRMHIFGGEAEYDAGVNWGTSLNYKTGSTFSSATDGTFNTTNWTNSTSKQTSVYTNEDYSNTSGSAINIYFRAGMKATSSTTARYYGDSGTGGIRKWYELIQI